jgi:hypothetical protein
MWRLIFGALRARWRQGAVLFLLATFAIGASAAAPMYATAAGHDVRLDEVLAATAADRVISARNARMPGEDPGAIEAIRGSLRAAARGSDLTDLLALDLLVVGPNTATMTVLARDGMCEHIVVTGRCARAAGEAVVSPESRWRVGDEIPVADPPMTLRVVGTYRVVDAAEPYWAGRSDVDSDPDRPDAPVLVSPRTLLDSRPTLIGVTLDLVALDPAAILAGPRLYAAVESVRRATPNGFTVTTGLPGLIRRVDNGQRALRGGGVVVASQLVLVCAFVLLLAVGHLATQHRSEAALAALRGAPARHRFVLAVGPNVALLLVATSVGFAVGWLAALAAARLSLAASVPIAATATTYAAAGGTALAAISAEVVGGSSGIRWGQAPSSALLNLLPRTPPGRRGWRAGLVELVVVALAAAAVYQLGDGGGAGTGIAELTPMLLVLACGLVAGQAVRPAASRLLALIAVAVGLFGQAVCGLDTAGRAALARAPTPGCADGCRLAWFGFATSPGDLRLHELRQVNPDRVLVDGARFASAGLWRPGFNTASGEVTVLHGPDWLGARYTPPPPAAPSEVRVAAADTPVPLPVVAAGPSFPHPGEADRVLGIGRTLRSVEVVAVAGGLAVGMAASPGLLLVDESTSQLDTAGRDEVLDALERVKSERGTTVVVVTHDTEVGARMGPLVTIRDGRVGAEGRGGLELAVVAGDGTVQLPPDVLGDFPPGTLFAVEHVDGAVTLLADRAAADPGRRASDQSN